MKTKMLVPYGPLLHGLQLFWIIVRLVWMAALG